MSNKYFTFQNKVAAPQLWGSLLKPSTFKDPKTGREGKTEYICKVILDPNNDDYKALRTVFVESARSKWPTADNAFLSALVKPFKNGDTIKSKDGKAYDFLAGRVLYTAKSVNPPTLSYLNEQGDLVDAENEAQRAEWKRRAFDGSEAYINTTLVPYQVGTSAPCVTAYINNVLVLGRGVRLAGAPASSEVFSAYIGQASAENPLGQEAQSNSDSW